MEDGRSAAAIRTQMWSPPHVKGDFSAVYTAVETEVRRVLDERGLSIPTVPSEMLGDWRFHGEYFQGMLRALMQLLPPEGFGGVVSMLFSTGSPDDWREMERRIPDLADKVVAPSESSETQAWHVLHGCKQPGRRQSVGTSSQRTRVSRQGE
ncbi:MAG: hypothetical protein ACE5KX_02665 [Acidimicrobiia bacterium]